MVNSQCQIRAGVGAEVDAGGRAGRGGKTGKVAGLVGAVGGGNGEAPAWASKGI